MSDLVYEAPQGFTVDETGPVLSADCGVCGWRTIHNRADRDRFRHSLKVHKWHFCHPER